MRKKVEAKMSERIRQFLCLTAILMLLAACSFHAATPSAGSTWTRPVDDAVMVYIPAGEFLMGSTDDDPGAGADEKPQHTVYLDAFWIDKYEVTNAQYRKCMEAGACKGPDEACKEIRDSPGFSAPEQPVLCVSWHDAQAYAAWVGGQLPTEAEWEKAARGTDGRKYPWGNDPPDCSKANCTPCEDLPVAVGSYPSGASPYGVLDMAGNASEWVADWYDEKYYSYSPLRNPQGPPSGETHVFRGGSCCPFFQGSGAGRPWCARSTFRYHLGPMHIDLYPTGEIIVPEYRVHLIGLRVVVPSPSGIDQQ